MNKGAANFIFFFCILAVIFFFPGLAMADTAIDLAVNPSLIDIPACEKGRICLEKEIEIKNNSAVQASVYAQVYDISPENGLIDYKDPSELPANSSLTRWIEFYRAVIDIPPGKTVKQTLKITASPDAAPGIYHAEISFPAGLNRTAAQAADEKENQSKLFLNMEITEHKVERLEINVYKPAKIIFFSNPIGCILKIKNIGNQPLTPNGEILLYDKGGKQVNQFSIVSSSVAPGEIKDFSVSGSLKIHPGKYKSVLALSYGESSKNLTDIVYFSYLPWKLAVLLLPLLVILIIVLTYYLSRRRRQKEGKNIQKQEEMKKNDPEKKPEAKKLNKAKYTINLKKN